MTENENGNALKTKVSVLLNHNNVTLKEVCNSLDISYTSCLRALRDNNNNYVHLHRIADYFKADINWLTNASAKIDDLPDSNNERPDPYINRELINFDDDLKNAFDILDKIKDGETRNAVSVVVENYRFMELFLINLSEEVIDLEELLQKVDAPYSEKRFRRMEEKINRILKKS